MTVMQPPDLLVAVSEICHYQSERHGENKTEPNEFSGQIGNQFYGAESVPDMLQCCLCWGFIPFVCQNGIFTEVNLSLLARHGIPFRSIPPILKSAESPCM